MVHGSVHLELTLCPAKALDAHISAPLLSCRMYSRKQLTTSFQKEETSIEKSKKVAIFNQNTSHRAHGSETLQQHNSRKLTSISHTPSLSLCGRGHRNSEKGKVICISAGRGCNQSHCRHTVRQVCVFFSRL